MSVPGWNRVERVNARQWLLALSIGFLLVGAVWGVLRWRAGSRREKQEVAIARSPAHGPPEVSAPHTPLRAGAPCADGSGTACSGAEPRAQASPEHASLGLFAKLSLSTEQQRLLYEADESSVALCMRERGFTYVLNSFDAPDDTSLGPQRPDDVEAASAHGYGLAEQVGAPKVPPPDANAEQLNRLSADEQRAWSEALSGPPMGPAGPTEAPGLVAVTTPGGVTIRWRTDSCLVRARRAVYGDDVKQTKLIAAFDALNDEVTERAHADPEYRAGVERWRTCMRGRGFSYDEPGGAAEALAAEFEEDRLGLPELRERELRVATADAGCFGESGLSSALDAAKTRAKAVVEREHQGVLQEYVTFQKEALARAQQLAHH